MPYDVYVQYLQSICYQLDVEAPLFSEPIILAADSDSIRRRKVQGAMEDAKLGMIRLLANRSILIVLDDVWSQSAVPWLNFANRMGSHLRVLLSTRLRVGFSRAKNIEVGSLTVQEATTLLLSESGCQHAELTSEEQSLAFDIATRCRLPVSICIAGRRLASSNDRCRCFQQLASEISEARAHLSDPQRTMYALTDRCFVGIGDAMKASFVAFAAIFTTNEGKRALVTADAAAKFVDALLMPEDRNRQPWGQQMVGVNVAHFLLQQLHEIGLIDRHDGGYQIHHDSGKEYARHILNDKRERALLFQKRMSHAVGSKQALLSVKSSKTLVRALHTVFVQACTADNLSHASDHNYWQNMEDDGYCFVRLTWHLIISQQSRPLARQVLCSSPFFKRRVDAMGTLPGVRATVQDIDALYAISQSAQDKQHCQDSITAAFEMISDFIAAEGTALLDAGNAFVLLAQYFQKHFR